MMMRILLIPTKIMKSFDIPKQKKKYI